MLKRGMDRAVQLIMVFLLQLWLKVWSHPELGLKTKKKIYEMG
jgi:hypothetical protein